MVTVTWSTCQVAREKGVVVGDGGGYHRIVTEQAGTASLPDGLGLTFLINEIS